MFFRHSNVIAHKPIGMCIIVCTVIASQPLHCIRIVAHAHFQCDLFLGLSAALAFILINLSKVYVQLETTTNRVHASKICVDKEQRIGNSNAVQLCVVFSQSFTFTLRSTSYLEWCVMRYA